MICFWFHFQLTMFQLGKLPFLPFHSKLSFSKLFVKEMNIPKKNNNLLILKCWIKGISKRGIIILKKDFFTRITIWGKNNTLGYCFWYTYDDDRLKSDISCGAESVSLNPFSSGIAVSFISSLGFPTLSSNWTKVS